MKKIVLAVGLLALVAMLVGSAIAYSVPIEDFASDDCDIWKHSAADIDWCKCGMMPDNTYTPGGLCGRVLPG